MSGFGKVSALGLDTESWKNHDATKTWGDSGDVDKALAPAADALRAVVAEHVKEAVLEFALSAEFGLAVSQGQLFIIVRYWADAAEFTTQVPVRSLLNAALKDAFGAAANPKGQEMMTAIAVLARDLGQLTKKAGAA